MDDKLILEHRKEKQESRDFKERRFDQWKENYFLYRDKVTTNRLTQRQAINIPIMRETNNPPEIFRFGKETNRLVYKVKLHQ